MQTISADNRDLGLETTRIVVEVFDEEHERRTKKAFEGRFIIGSESDSESFTFNDGTGARGGGNYAIAITKANRIVVLMFNRYEEPIEFMVHEDFDAFKRARDNSHPMYPESLVSAVAAEIEIDYIEELDI